MIKPVLILLTTRVKELKIDRFNAKIDYDYDRAIMRLKIWMIFGTLFGM